MALNWEEGLQVAQMGCVVGQWGKAPCVERMGHQAVHVEEVGG